MESFPAYIVIKQQQPLLCVSIVIFQLLLWNERRLPRGVFLVDLRQEHLHENGCPSMRCVRRDDFIQLLVSVELLSF